MGAFVIVVCLNTEVPMRKSTCCKKIVCNDKSAKLSFIT
uniref:Uncharacterized protein n=1 Tax=Rhizophora mucronata TaxID=61149 RepID=A0A2P2MI84_RHIMU